MAGQSWRCRLQRTTVWAQLCGPTASYFRRFGVWESADAAAAFSDFVLLGLASTLPAAEAAFEPV